MRKTYASGVLKGSFCAKGTHPLRRASRPALADSYCLLEHFGQPWVVGLDMPPLIDCAARGAWRRLALVKWEPEDRLNAYAARLIAEQPDPPRRVRVDDIIKTDLLLLGLMTLFVVLFGVGLVFHQGVSLTLLGVTGVATIATWVVWQTSVARNALHLGLAASGTVTRVVVGYKGSRATTFEVDGPAGAVETTLVRAAGANVLVEGDVVQVMVDPKTSVVLLVLGLLKPSPLYEAPKS